VLRFFISYFIFLGLIACEKNQELLVQDYFPVKENAEALYQISETNYTLNEPGKTQTYFLRELFTQVEGNGAGGITFNIAKYTKAISNENWKLIEVISGRKIGSEYILNIKNEDKVLLLQPLSESSLWNYNAYNTQKEKKIKQINFDTDLAKITVEADSNLLNQKLEVNYFKNKVGLVYHEKRDLTYCQENPACIGKNEISYRLVLIQKRIEKIP
jgi:hypothetical protein